MAPELNRETFDKPLWAEKPTTKNREDLLAFFFLYCKELLLENQPITRNPRNTGKPNQELSDSQNQQRWNFKRVGRNIIPSCGSLIFALKCSLAIGFAVLFSLLYNKENGYCRMYDQSGGISAATGALLILGRDNYGAPSEFAIVRIIEASIGLLCFLTVEIAFLSNESGDSSKKQALTKHGGASRLHRRRKFVCTDFYRIEG
ncbi:hypothetical protein ACFX19_033177 [Malus domestica]